MSYLANLTLRLTAGMAGLPEAVRSRHVAFLLAQQHNDGGFTGREGSGDLYYTSFALRALSMLDALDEPTAVRVARFIEERLDRQLPSIDFISLVTCAMLVEMASDIDVFERSGRDLSAMAADFFDPFARDDGGYAKTPRGGQSSTYHTFLVAGCREMVGLAQDRAESMAGLIRTRQRDDGGFVEIGPMRHGGTNPTAAAIGLLRMLDALDEPTRTAAVRFLAAMQTGEGGLRANTKIPVADLLSTFTGLVALADLDALSTVDTAAAMRFAQSLEQREGGFRGGIWDDTADVEYTFYGLGTLALLS